MFPSMRRRTVSSLPAKRGRRVRQPRVVAFHRFVRRGMRPSFAYSSPSLELPKVLYCWATLLLLIIPGVDFDASSKGQGSDDSSRRLGLGLRGGRRRREGPVGWNPVAQVRTYKVGDLLRPVLERLEEKLRGVVVLLIGRVPEEFDPLPVRGLFLFRRAGKVKVAKRCLLVEVQGVKEPKLGVYVMSE